MNASEVVKEKKGQQTVQEQGSPLASAPLEGSDGRALLDAVDFGSRLPLSLLHRVDGNGKNYWVDPEAAAKQLPPERLNSHRKQLEIKLSSLQSQMGDVQEQITLTERVYNKLYGENTNPTIGAAKK